MEKNLLAAQAGIEAAALELHQRPGNHVPGQNYLTEYCSSTALKALDVAKKVLTKLYTDMANEQWQNTVCPAP